jgi:hypothetical protein
MQHAIRHHDTAPLRACRAHWSTATRRSPARGFRPRRETTGPTRSVTRSPFRADCVDHLPDLLVGELIKPATDNPGSSAASTNGGPSCHQHRPAPRSAAGRVRHRPNRAEPLTSFTRTYRNATHDLQIERPEVIADSRPRPVPQAQGGGPMSCNSGGPMTVAKPPAQTGPMTVARHSRTSRAAITASPRTSPRHVPAGASCAIL